MTDRTHHGGMGQWLIAPGAPLRHTFIPGGGCMSRCRCGRTFSDPLHGPQPEHIRKLREAVTESKP